jgi:hypothetical protein
MQTRAMTSENHWLPGFNFNVEEWDAEGLHYTAAHHPQPEGAGVMFAAGLLIGMSFGVLLTIVGTVWLGSLADEG